MDRVHNIQETPEQWGAFFRVLMEAAYDGFLIVQDGAIIEASPALLTASGYSANELIGRPAIDFIAEEFRDAVRQRHEEKAEGTFEAVAVVKDGRQLIIEIVTRNVEIGGQRSRISAVRDVTQKRRLEAQLHQAQRMDALGRLASGIAHDFNNILTIVRSYGDMLARELADPHRRDATEILKAADAGAALTRQLLSFGRHQIPNRAPIDLNVLVKDSEQMLRRLIGRNIELVDELAPDLGLVNADRTQLQQVILNLAINACDAMPHGGRLRTRTRNVDVTDAKALGEVPARPGQYIMLAVDDSGAGMSNEVKAQVFEPFFTTKDPGRGTGLGLAIVREIVEQSKGFIVVDSTIGVGSTFAVYLPMIARTSATE